MDKVKILSNLEIAPDIYSLTFRKLFDFIPGQVVKISTHTAIAPRMYSIASGNNEPEIQIIYDIKPEGELTNVLKSLKVHDEVFISPPFGQFTCNEKVAWWIATGTGIAPFYSMIKSERKLGIMLLHGVRNPETLLFKDEFHSLMNDHYIPCCSGKKIEGVYFGRVTEYLRQMDKIQTGVKYYLCGSAEMVVNVRDILIEKGVAFGDIVSEIYF